MSGHPHWHVLNLCQETYVRSIVQKKYGQLDGLFRKPGKVGCMDSQGDCLNRQRESYAVG